MSNITHTPAEAAEISGSTLAGNLMEALQAPGLDQGERLRIIQDALLDLTATTDHQHRAAAGFAVVLVALGKDLIMLGYELLGQSCTAVELVDGDFSELADKLDELVDAGQATAP